MEKRMQKVRIIKVQGEGTSMKCRFKKVPGPASGNKAVNKSCDCN